MMNFNLLPKYAEGHAFLDKFFNKNYIIVGSKEDLTSLRVLQARYSPNSLNMFLETNSYISNIVSFSSDQLNALHAYDAIVILDSIDCLKSIEDYEFRSFVLDLPVLKFFNDIFLSYVLYKKIILKRQFEPVQQPTLSYAILTTPRSGSTFLCELLKSTKLAGHPKEHFRQPCIELAKAERFDCLKYLKTSMSLDMTRNSVFGTKFISHFLIDFKNFNEVDFNYIIRSLFSKFIRLSRQDKIAQAVSAFVAKKTNIWHISSDEKYLEHESKLSKINWDSSNLLEIKKIHDAIIKNELFIEGLCKDYDLVPMEVEYEDLIENPAEVIGGILAYLDISEDSISQLPLIKPKLKKSRSNFSKQIVDRYKEEFRL